MLDSAKDLAQQPGNWSTHPNRGYVGKIERVLLSPTESWTPEFYIDQFLQSHGRPVTHWNRNVVAAALGKFNYEPPYTRTTLDRYLDEVFDLAPA